MYVFISLFLIFATISLFESNIQMTTEQENYNPSVPNKPLLCDIYPQSLLEWPSKVQFRGWLLPQRRWKEWVRILSPRYAAVWKQTGIYEAVMSSTYQMPRNLDLVLGLSEFWSPETNTFVFPWGEVTVTLEDIMILGGLPVVGECVTTPLDEEITKIDKVLEKERVEMCRSSAQKAAHCSWIARFMGKDDDELEHVAFLSLWLSRYVFPSLSGSVRNHVFPIAIRLSRGAKVALAPSVLASIYHDLRVMREGALELKETIHIVAPFQLLQLWVFERFSPLGPKSQNTLKIGEPRVARWHKLGSKVSNLPLVRSALRIEGNFEWRPYACDLVNWRHLAYYRETRQTRFMIESSLDEKLRCFSMCLSSSELVGVDCEEKYFPHRVVMQFGLDQDVPSDPKKIDVTRGNAKFLVPPRNYRSCASNRYITWWNNMMTNRKKVLECVLKEDKYAKIVKEYLGSVSSSDRVNPKSCDQCSEKCRTDFHTTTREPIISDSSDVYDIPPGFHAKHGSSSCGKSRSCDQSENVVPSNTEKVNDVDGRARTRTKVKVEEIVLDDEPIDIDKLEEEKDSNSGKGIHVKGKKAKEATKELNFFDKSAKHGLTSFGKNQSKNDVPSSKEKVNANSEKRKKANGDRAGTGKKVKIAEIVLESESVDLDKLEEEAEQSRKRCESGKGSAAKGKKAGLTADNPIDVDDYLFENSTRKPQKPEQDIEERVAKLEKMMEYIKSKE